MTNTLTKRNRDKVRKAIEPALKEHLPPQYFYHNNKADLRKAEDDFIECIIPLLPNGISQDAHDMLYGSKEVNERIAKEDDMRERIERTFSTRPTDSPDWVRTIRALVKAEDEKGWDIERFKKWNEDEDQKYEKLRFGDLVKKPVLLIAWLPRAFETDTSHEGSKYDTGQYADFLQ